MLYLNACHRCKGTLQRDHDSKYQYVTCLMCGYEKVTLLGTPTYEDMSDAEFKERQRRKRREQVWAMSQDGVPIMEIAAHFKVERSTINRDIRRMRSAIKCG